MKEIDPKVNVQTVEGGLFGDDEGTRSLLS